MFTANEPGILQISDRNFESTGKLVFLRASLGQISGPVDEGGSFCVTTLLKDPLPLGEEVSNTLTLLAKDTFTTSKETFAHTLGECSNAGIRVLLPQTKPAKSARAFRIFLAGEVEPIPDEVLQTPSLLQLEIRDGPLGSRYVLEWNW